MSVSGYFAMLGNQLQDVLKNPSPQNVLDTIGDFWGGEGFDLHQVLVQSGWASNWINTGYFWELRYVGPEGPETDTTLRYTEGDLHMEGPVHTVKPLAMATKVTDWTNVPDPPPLKCSQCREPIESNPTGPTKWRHKT